MSYTEIYKFKKDGNAECFAEVKNSWRGAMAIWRCIEKRYLPKFTPVWAMGDTSKEYSRTADMMGGSIKEIWAVASSDKISETDQIVLASTFDNVVVMKDEIPRLIEAFRNFEGETSLKEQADLIENAYKNDSDLIAIAWNQTSVNGDVWMSGETELDEGGDEIYLPYNLLNNKKHWDLFESEKA